MIKDMLSSDQPRERLKKLGAEALSSEELLAILLRTGNKERSVIMLARQILDKLDDIIKLKNITLEELLSIKGVKEAKAATIMAAIELGKRLSKKFSGDSNKINSILDVYELLKERLEDLEQEHFVCIYLDTKSNVIKTETVFIGTNNTSVIHSRDIFKHAIKCNASAIVLAHNHPSGDALASVSDYKTTREIVKAGDIMGIKIIEHLVIGKNQYYSIMQNKLFKI